MFDYPAYTGSVVRAKRIDDRCYQSRFAAGVGPARGPGFDRVPAGECRRVAGRTGRPVASRRGSPV